MYLDPFARPPLPQGRKQQRLEGPGFKYLILNVYITVTERTVCLMHWNFQTPEPFST